MNLPAALASATYDADNRLTNWSGTTLTYDANGSLTGDGSLTYGWDSRGRLASLAGTATASFTYDAMGRRSAKTVNGTATNFLYDGPNAVQELAGATPTANLLTGVRIDEIYSRTDGLGARSFITDALGSTVALTDTSGALKTSYAYDPYGKSSAAGEISSNSAQYTGRENDGTGLFYYRARYYQPVFGRFLSEDPIGLNGGANLYAYVDGDPISYIDPRGLQAWRPGMVPPSNVPGGPWTPAGAGQRPGTFFGPKPPSGGREICQYVPDKANGGPPNAENGYWKTNTPGERGWYRYDLNGNPITEDEAHPKPNSEPSSPSIPQLTPWGIAVFLGTYSSPAY
ncbi:RHS repeat-associated core domain-containing protein [Burkholderia sp. PR2]|uniref:RHS repeat-associated core domain-containing protein n=1 Tax=Burkholderia sp. PR2 TaxID=3448078 RepID=UPI00402A7364